MFKCITKKGNNEPTIIKETEDYLDAVNSLIDFASNNYGYCLDSEDDRKVALMTKGFCYCGCGPYLLKIEEFNG